MKALNREKFNNPLVILFQKIIFILPIFLLIFNVDLKAQKYYTFSSNTDSIVAVPAVSAVAQSAAGTVGSVANINDGSYSTGAQTTSTVNAWIRVDMGVVKTISYVDIAALSSTSYLNARALQVSTDNINWSTVVSSISGTTTTSLKRLSFTPISARYIRVYNPSATAGIVSVSELIPQGFGATIIPAAQNNLSSTLLNLGFNFNYQNTNYSQISVNSNGLVRLGSTVATTEAVNSFVSTANASKLFALWDDIATGTAATNGGVKFWVSGTLPNRVAIIDWKCNKANLTTGAVDLNFQVLLYETTGVIEFRYGSGVNPTSASIGLSGKDVANDIMSVTPSASSTCSNLVANNAVAIWPSTNTKYTFTPTEMNGTKTVPGDFSSIKTAVMALNWAGVPSTGGVVIDIAGGVIDTAFNAVCGTSPTSPAGLLIRATGTATTPITIKWNGTGNKPILYSGVGCYNWDYVLGIAGGDYITLEGLNIREAASNTTGNAIAEIGIGLFKKRYSTTLGNDGCDNITIKNCDIALTRLGIAGSASSMTYAYNNLAEEYYTRGIYATHYTSKHEGVYTSSGYGVYSVNHSTGIKTQIDVHQNCQVISNNINNCSIGVEFSDGWLKSGSLFYAGTKNIIGKVGQGNTITNWGCDPTATSVYASSAYNGGTVMAGIISSGQKDFTIEYNNISTGISEKGTTSYIQNFIGILVGRSSCRQGFPQYAPGFFVKINNNTIDSINANINNISGIGKSAYGIAFIQAYDPSVAVSSTTISSGNVEINNNTISGLTAGTGYVKGIASSIRLYNAYSNAIGTDASNEYKYFATSGSISLKNNIIKKFNQPSLQAAGSTTLGFMAGIHWNVPAKKLYIENNTIGGANTEGFVQGSLSNAYLNDQILGIRGIYIDMTNRYVNRDSLIIKNNTITNLDRLAGTITNYTLQRTAGASAILVYRGANINNIQNNTISDMNIANGLYGSAVGDAFEIIRVDGIPQGGVSNINIYENTINNCSRTQFGFLTTMANGSGAESFVRGISVSNTSISSIKKIYKNTISNFTQTPSYGATLDNRNFITRLEAISVRSKNVKNNNIFIYENNINNISGHYTAYQTSYSTTAWSKNFGLVGITAGDYDKCHIYGNTICNLSTTTLGSNINTSTFVNGVTGIQLGKTGTGASAIKTTVGEAVYNNFISDLSAPNINDVLAIQGIYYWGYGRFAKIVHNTIALGGIDGGVGNRIGTNSTFSFGVSGVTFNNYYWNTAAYATLFSNNIISINATPMGSTTNTTLSGTTTGGIGTCWRHIPASTVKKKPKGIDISSGGNVYYINNDFRNFIYGQGIRYWNSTSGTRNCYGYNTAPPSNYTNTTYNILNDIQLPKLFNHSCGLYKSFWGAPEKRSFIELDVNNIMQILPFTNTGATCNAKLNIQNGSASYVAKARPIPTPLSISTDFYQTTRTGSYVTAGAHENNTNITGPNLDIIDFAFTPICDGVCTGNKTLTVTITPPEGKQISTVTNKKPRLYFRRILNTSAMTVAQVDSNVMVNAANNLATGAEGWRYVEYSSVTGDDYTFIINESLLKNNVATTPTYTIEYFLIAETTDGTVCDWSSGDMGSICPTTVDLFAIGGKTLVPSDDDGDVAVDENSVSDRYTVYKTADLTKSLVLNNNNVVYTANTDPAITICPGDTVSITARYLITALGESFDDDCLSYRFEVADNSTFTTNLETFIQSDSTFKYALNSTTKKYFRIWLDCGSGSGLTGSNTIYISVAINTLTATLTPPANRQECVGSNIALTATGTSVTNHLYFWYDNNGLYYNQSVNGTSASITIPNVQPEQSGTWSVLRAIATTTLANQGLKSASLSTVAGDNSGDVLEGKGLAFTAEKPVKINSVILRDVGTDAAATNGFRIALKTVDDRLLYETAALSVADNAVATVTFTNWIVSPGQYMLVITPDGANVPSGELAFQSTLFPVTIGGDNVISLDGGVEDYDASSLSDSYNYFFDLNVTPYCDYNKQGFDIQVLGKSALNGIDTLEYDTLRMGQTFTVPFSGLPDNFNRAKIKGFSATGKQGILTANWVSDTTYSITASGILGGIDTIMLFLHDTTFASCIAKDSMVLIVSTIPGCVDEVLLVEQNTKMEGFPSCTNSSGWTYYVHPETNQAIAAVYANGNAWNPSLVRVDVTNGVLKNVSGRDSAAVMKRMVTIDAAGNYTVNGGLKLRFYYNTEELNTEIPNNAYTIRKWFKHQGDKASVLSNLTSSGLANMMELVPSSVGIEAEVEYVEFENITSFSTFGFIGSTIIGPDSDNDGIKDAADIDDDNDGVLDVTEYNTNSTLAIQPSNSANFVLCDTVNNMTFTTTGGTVGTGGTNMFSILEGSSGTEIGDVYTFNLNKAVDKISLYIDNLIENTTIGNFKITYSDGTTSSSLDFNLYTNNPYSFSQSSSDVLEKTYSNSTIPSVRDKNPTGLTTNADQAAGTLEFVGLDPSKKVRSLSFTILDENTGISSNSTALVAIVATCNTDTDGDGIPNILDLDSDQDGCSDALESSATTNTAANYQFTGTFGNNGLINTKETTADGGTINYASTYSQYAINPILKLCKDSDTDMIPDYLDIDDDNDGIIDETENYCATGTLVVPTSGTSNHNWGYSSINYTINGAGLTGTGLTASHNSNWEPEFGWLGADGLTTASLEYNFAANTNLTGIALWTTINNLWNAAEGPIKNFQIIVTYGASNTWTSPIKTTISYSRSTLQVFSFDTLLTNVSKVRLQIYDGWGYGSSNYASPSTFGAGYNLTLAEFRGVSTCMFETLDSDNDGIANRLDTDSDGDGCSDAYESGASTNLNPNHVLTGTMGTNGFDNSKETILDNGRPNYTPTYANALDNTLKPCCPTVNVVSNQSACLGTTTSNIIFSGNMTTGVTYNWVNNNSNIGLPSNGTGNINAFTVSNTGTANITVTPSTASCVGSPLNFDIITINKPQSPTLQKRN